MLQENVLSFEELLVRTPPNKYEISAHGAMMNIYETQCAYINIYKQAMSEAILLSDESTNSIKKLMEIVGKLIDGLIRLITMAVKKLVGIFKLFQARAKDVYMNNKDFMHKYGAKLSTMGNISVDVEGYDMDASKLISKAVTIGGESQSIFGDAKMIILDGKKYFDENNTLSDKLEELRLLMLNSDDPRLVSNTDAFKKAVKDKYYGEFKTRTYSVNDALNQIRNYTNNVASIRSMNDAATRQGNRDIEELNRLKKLMKGNSSYQNPKELINQLNMLIKYRTQALQDTIYVFETVMQCIDDTNIQSKAVCILALQQN